MPGSTLQLGNGGASGSITGNVLDNGTFAINRSDSFTFGNEISGTGALQQNGTGTLILTGANTYTGVTTISAGSTLQLGNGGASGSITGDVLDNGTFAINDPAGFTFGNVISGTGALQQNGTGTLILTGANTYKGGTTINAGTLALGGVGRIASSSGVTLTPGAFFDISGLTAGRTTIKSLAGRWRHRDARLQSADLGERLRHLRRHHCGKRWADAHGRHRNPDRHQYLYGRHHDQCRQYAPTRQRRVLGLHHRRRSGQRHVRHQPLDRLYLRQRDLRHRRAPAERHRHATLTGANTYTGGTTISAGTLELGNGGASGSITGDVLDNGTFAINRSDSFTFGNVISGTGALQQNGTGTLILTGANTYTGGTTINAGTLALGGVGRIASSSGVTLTPGAFFDISGLTAGRTTIKSLAGAGGTVTLGSKVLTLANGSGTFGGTIAGNGGLTLTAGTETLIGTNTYTGGTTISAGSTLQLGNGGASGSITGDVLDNGTFAINDPAGFTFGNVISGTGALQQNGGTARSRSPAPTPIRAAPRSVPARWSSAAAVRSPTTSPSPLPARPCSSTPAPISSVAPSSARSRPTLSTCVSKPSPWATRPSGSRMAFCPPAR